MPESPSEDSSNLGPTPSQRFKILLMEMELLQSRFDKYDDIILRNRFWMVTIIIAVLGFAFKQHQVRLVYLSFIIVVFFYIVESMWRWRYMHKYSLRYKFLREYLNWLNNRKNLETKNSDKYRWINYISLYDLTNETQEYLCKELQIEEIKHDVKIFNTRHRWEDTWRDCVLKPELGIFYGGLIIITGITVIVGKWEAAPILWDHITLHNSILLIIGTLVVLLVSGASWLLDRSTDKRA